MTRIAPKIENAPGIVWRPLINDRWMAKWQARTDLKLRGYLPKYVRVWMGTEDDLTPEAVEYIQHTCNELQTAMLIWGRGGVTVVTNFDDTVGSLIHCYKNDPDSPYLRARYLTRQNYDSLCKRLEADIGGEKVADLKVRQFKRLHEQWSMPAKPGGLPRIAMAHSCMTMLRILMGFGSTYLESDECARISAILHSMKFKNAKPRNERLTYEQAEMIRAKAHEEDRASIALAQGFQFEGMFRQKDVIGEWVPISEPGISATTSGNAKWLRGLRWEEIDENLILRHVTSKRQKEIEIDLKNAPMVVEELNIRYPGCVAEHEVTDRATQEVSIILIGHRELLPASGPVVVSEDTSLPYTAGAYRGEWRRLARLCAIPDAVYNMDSRAGAISESTDAGADLHHVQHFATHSDISMTQRYSRGTAEKVVGVQHKRVAFRNKSGTK